MKWCPSHPISKPWPMGISPPGHGSCGCEIARVAHIRGPHFETIAVVMDWDDETKTVTRQQTKHSQPTSQHIYPLSLQRDLVNFPEESQKLKTKLQNFSQIVSSCHRMHRTNPWSIHTYESNYMIYIYI